MLLLLTRCTSSPKLHFDFCKSVLDSDLTQLPLGQKSWHYSRMMIFSLPSAGNWGPEWMSDLLVEEVSPQMQPGFDKSLLRPAICPLDFSYISAALYLHFCFCRWVAWHFIQNAYPHTLSSFCKAAYWYFAYLKNNLRDQPEFCQILFPTIWLIFIVLTDFDMFYCVRGKLV